MRIGRSNLIEVREVNPATGEVVAIGTKLKRFENFVPNKGYLFKPQEHYIRMFAGNPLPDDLPIKSAYYMYRLAVHLENETNRLYVSRSRKNYAMTLSTMAAYLGMGYRKCMYFVKDMMRRHIMARVTIDKSKTNGQHRVEYYVNPLYFFRGKWISYQLYLIFQEDLDKVLPKWVQYRFAESHRNIDEINEQREKEMRYGENGTTDYVEADTSPALPPPSDSAVHGKRDVGKIGAGHSEGTLPGPVLPGSTDEVPAVQGT